MNGFLGWGDPRKALIVFVGFEPGGDFWTPREQTIDNMEGKFRLAERRMRVYRGCSVSGLHFLQRKQWYKELGDSPREFFAKWLELSYESSE